MRFRENDIGAPRMASDSRQPNLLIHDKLRLLRLARPDAAETTQFLTTWPLQDSCEAALALMAATVLENALESAIATHFAVNREEAETIFVDQSEGSLSAFSMKIKLAYVLGVIEKKVRKELTLIKTIRNGIAHAQIDAAFTSEQVATSCHHLFIAKELPFGEALGPRPQTAKERYAKSIEYMFAYFSGSVTRDTERVPLLYDDSDFYILAFLNRENYPRGFAKRGTAED
jgi:DNA-binding MltR family transcriptional regulator